MRTYESFILDGWFARTIRAAASQARMVSNPWIVVGPPVVAPIQIIITTMTLDTINISPVYKVIIPWPEANVNLKIITNS